MFIDYRDRGGRVRKAVLTREIIAELRPQRLLPRRGRQHAAGYSIRHSGARINRTWGLASVNGFAAPLTLSCRRLRRGWSEYLARRATQLSLADGPQGTPKVGSEKANSEIHMRCARQQRISTPVQAERSPAIGTALTDRATFSANSAPAWVIRGLENTARSWSDAC